MTDHLRTPLATLADELASLRLTSRQLVNECLTRISSTQGEGSRTYLKVYGEQALATADFYDSMRKAGARLARHAGIPVSIKDLFDVAGDTTLAASAVLRGTAPAACDAVIVQRLRAAGFIIVGRTNMTEFAFSGLGLNPHYGTPRNPWDRATGRIPGGSSSGAAVSITDSMAYGAIGTDTGGSCRIPAALCGIVGFKPTASRVPVSGTFPLSPTLDSIGPLGNSVACCASLDAVLAGETDYVADTGFSAAELRFGVVTNYVTDELDNVVASTYERALRALSRAGVRLTDIHVPELGELRALNSKGGLAASEAYAHHRARLAQNAAQYDQRVSTRILRGREQDAADYIELLNARRNFIENVGRRLARFDAVVMPTLPRTAPAFSELTADDSYIRINALILRNPSIVNFLDGCAISLPCQAPNDPPVGLSLFGLRNSDRTVLSAAAAIESIVAGDG